MTATPTNNASTYILIYTDGSCLRNPGPGGCAAVLRKYEGGSQKGNKLIVHDRAVETTNNRMELGAAICALRALKRAVHPVLVVSDSEYLVEGMKTRLPRWKANGWKTADKKDVRNADLWVELDELASTQTVEWRWVRAHASDEFNKEVDQLARKEAQKASKELALA